MYLGDFFRKETIENPIYRIGTVQKIDYIGKNASNWLVFRYNIDEKENQGKVYIPNEESEFYKSKIGQRYIVAMNNKEIINYLFKTYRFYIEYPIPDSIKSATFEGWRELPKWAKKNDKNNYKIPVVRYKKNFSCVYLYPKAVSVARFRRN